MSGSYGPDRLPVSADGFTKGWIGVPPHEKRTARTTSQQNDRDNQIPKPIPRRPNGKKEAPSGFSANRAQKIARRPLTHKALSGRGHNTAFLTGLSHYDSAGRLVTMTAYNAKGDDDDVGDDPWRQRR